MWDAVRSWAREEFSELDLGDVRRRERLFAMVSRVGERPAGTVTRVFRSPAEREGAFRWLESEAVEAKSLQTGLACATLRRCKSQRTVFVAVDTTGLTFADTYGRKGLGPIGRRLYGARGLQAMSALVVDESGTTLGVCAQRYWTRSEKASPDWHKDDRPRHARESAQWLRMLSLAHARFAEHAPGTTPWYQLDRGGDFWPVLLKAQKCGFLLTVRAAYDRRVDARTRRLWATLRAQRVLGTMQVQVPERPGRSARVAALSVRAASVTLLLCIPGARNTPTRINAVFVSEKGSRSGSESVIEWMLLTTAEVSTFADARRVVHGYTMRWRIEEFHRAWKSGGCNVEQCQLRTRAAITKWATILAVVAARIERLKRLSREQPELPATEELSRDEIDAVITLGELRGCKPGDTPTIGEVVQAIARLGGYTGKSSGGPPGATVLSRGLADVAVAAKVLRLQRKL